MIGHSNLRQNSAEEDVSSKNKAFILKKYQLLSIAIKFSDGDEKFFVRKDHTYVGLLNLVAEFWDACNLFQNKLKNSLPDGILRGIEYYSNILNDKKKIRNYTPFERVRLQKKLKFLKSYTNLNIYSWVRIIRS